MLHRNTRNSAGWGGRAFVRICLAKALLLGGLPAGALAQQAMTGGETVGRVLDILNLRAPPAPAPDFVVNSRPDRDRLDYAPLTPPPPRSNKPSRAAAIEAELDAAAARNRARAGRVRSPDGAPPPRSGGRRGD